MERKLAERHEKLISFLRHFKWKDSMGGRKQNIVDLLITKEFLMNIGGKYAVELVKICEKKKKAITDDEIEYVGGVKLLSQPEIFKISEGESLEEDLYEYKDAKKWIEIRNDIKENRELDVLKYFRWKSLKEKYGLVDKYNIE